MQVGDAAGAVKTAGIVPLELDLGRSAELEEEEDEDGEEEKQIGRKNENDEREEKRERGGGGSEEHDECDDMKSPKHDGERERRLQSSMIQTMQQSPLSPLPSPRFVQQRQQQQESPSSSSLSSSWNKAHHVRSAAVETGSMHSNNSNRLVSAAQYVPPLRLDGDFENDDEDDDGVQAANAMFADRPRGISMKSRSITTTNMTPMSSSLNSSERRMGSSESDFAESGAAAGAAAARTKAEDEEEEDDDDEDYDDEFFDGSQVCGIISRRGSDVNVVVSSSPAGARHEPWGVHAASRSMSNVEDAPPVVRRISSHNSPPTSPLARLSAKTAADLMECHKDEQQRDKQDEQEQGEREREEHETRYDSAESDGENNEERQDNVELMDRVDALGDARARGGGIGLDRERDDSGGSGGGTGGGGVGNGGGGVVYVVVSAAEGGASLGTPSMPSSTRRKAAAGVLASGSTPSSRMNSDVGRERLRGVAGGGGSRPVSRTVSRPISRAQSMRGSCAQSPRGMPIDVGPLPMELINFHDEDDDDFIPSERGAAGENVVEKNDGDERKASATSLEVVDVTCSRERERRGADTADGRRRSSVTARISGTLGYGSGRLSERLSSSAGAARDSTTTTSTAAGFRTSEEPLKHDANNNEDEGEWHRRRRRTESCGAGVASGTLAMSGAGDRERRRSSGASSTTAVLFESGEQRERTQTANSSQSNTNHNTASAVGRSTRRLSSLRTYSRHQQNQQQQQQQDGGVGMQPQVRMSAGGAGWRKMLGSSARLASSSKISTEGLTASSSGDAVAQTSSIGSAGGKTGKGFMNGLMSPRSHQQQQQQNLRSTKVNESGSTTMSSVSLAQGDHRKSTWFDRMKRKAKR